MLKSALVLACALPLLLSGGAKANPPEKNNFATFSIPVLVCDKKEDVLLLADVGRQSQGKDSNATLSMMNKQLNANGQPVCWYGFPAPSIVGEVEQLKDTFTYDGRPAHAWTFAIYNPYGAFWVGYVELINHPPEESERKETAL
jgi:hypothetical protein